MELVILYKPTHTRNGGDTIDIISPLAEVGTGGFSYATNVGEDAYNNAKTVAFKGLLSKLAQLCLEVDADGSLEVIPASAASKGKRSLANRFHFDIIKAKLRTTTICSRNGESGQRC